MRAAEVDFESDDDDQDSFFKGRADRQPKATMQYQPSSVVQ